jgi:hypothetical protein
MIICYDIKNIKKSEWLSILENVCNLAFLGFNPNTVFFVSRIADLLFWSWFWFDYLKTGVIQEWINIIKSSFSQLISSTNPWTKLTGLRCFNIWSSYFYDEFERSIWMIVNFQIFRIIWIMVYFYRIWIILICSIHRISIRITNL